MKLDKETIAHIYNDNLSYKEIVHILKDKGFKKGEASKELADLAIIPVWKAGQFVRICWN